ncbi:unnamed protein product [Pieris macdunnoughi]|uniref:Uncharacterized protein n=1 Tax=Pieris macdunnoughi TaxID=345717 RepID=A0A821T1H2_9NEOP|nr:unnamed protein product [Pieris macdunnoughi]
MENITMSLSDYDESQGVIVAKGVSMAVLFCASMLCGIVPMLLAKRFRWITPNEAENLKSSNRIVASLLSFGGGVLLCTTLMHLLPGVNYNIDQLVAEGYMKNLDLPLASLLMCSGFFIMYLVEELVHMYLDHREKSNSSVAPLVRNLSIRRSNRTEENGVQSVTNSTSDLIDPSSITKGKDIEVNNADHSHGHSHANGHSHMPINDVDNVTAALRGLLIVLALSIHELFEGLAVGLESSTSNVWYMLGAISAHKLVIAFCIGVELIATRTKTYLAIIYITTFGIVSPLGIGIGILMVGGKGATAAGSYSVILQGLASGTLLYVIFFEIWKGDRSGILQYIAALFGFGLMFGLQLIMPHSHSHGEDEPDLSYNENGTDH